MQSWIPFFVIVAALAIVLQTLILGALFLQMRRLASRLESIANDLHSRVNPILGRIQVLVEDAQPVIASMIVDAAEITNMARGQVQRADRVLTESLDRLRMQLIHADQILTGVLETVEETGTKLRRTVWGPVQSVAAVVRGIQTGVEFYRGRRRAPEAQPTEQQDEGLFI
jgi:hypothetical protein